MRLRWMGCWLGLVAVVAVGQTSVQVGAGSVQGGAAVVDKRDAELEGLKKKLADWPQLGRYAEANAALPAKAAGRVVFYGDSITDNWGKPGFASVFFPGKPYVGRGISGQTTPQMVVRFQQDVVELHPEAVVILAGINDIAGNTGPMTAEMTEANFRSMVAIGKANGIRVVLCSILPAGKIPWRPQEGVVERVKGLNAWLKEYAGKEGLTYVDYWTAMAGADGGMKEGLSSDGVHPTRAGYEVMEPLAAKGLGGR